MSVSDGNKTVGGIGFTGLLQVAFIVLKLCKIIDWSWGWVLAPTWISASLIAIFFICVVIFYLFKRR